MGVKAVGRLLRLTDTATQVEDWRLGRRAHVALVAAAQLTEPGPGSIIGANWPLIGAPEGDCDLSEGDSWQRDGVGGHGLAGGQLLLGRTSQEGRMAREVWPRVLPAGDSAAVVEFGEAIDEEINRRVRSLDHLLSAEAQPGLGEAVPTYRSLLVHYDPLRLDYAGVAAYLLECARQAEAAPLPEPLLVTIPTVYGGEAGPDLESVARHNGLSVEEVIRIHSAAEYLVYMIGFTPGFPYLGGLDPRIAAPRLETPRAEVPAGSVGIAGRQTGVYPIASPGGWRIIGRTAVALFDPLRSPPVLLAAGDRVRFVPVEGGPGDGAGRR